MPITKFSTLFYDSLVFNLFYEKLKQTKKLNQFNKKIYKYLKLQLHHLQLHKVVGGYDYPLTLF